MKLRRCDWVPLSVANWLCEELDERGIPGTTYSHTLLSLLHPYFCPHPVPKDPNHSSKCLVQSESLRSFLEAGQARDFEILFEELEEHVHPDADFPDLNFSDNKKSGSKKAKKRLKKKFQELSNTPEKLWKEAARQCLSTASDDRDSLKVIVEELFQRLKNLKKQESFGEEIDSAFSDSSECHSDFEHKIDSSCINSSCFNIFDKNTLHSSHFPPLATPPNETSEKNELVVDWKTLIRDKWTPQKETFQPLVLSNRIVTTQRNVKRNLELEFCMIEENTVKPTMEIRANQISENPPMDLKSSHFLPILTSDPASFYVNEPGYDDVFESSQESQCESIKDKLEGWECASILPPREVREVSVDLLGSRLFERSTTGSASTTRCNSSSDLDEDRMKLMSHSVAQVWDCSTANSLQNKQAELVWGISNPSPQCIEGTRSHLVNSWTIPDQNNWNSQSDGNLNSLPLSKAWNSTANSDWGSQALFNSTTDPFLSSAVKSDSFPSKRKDNDSSSFHLARGNLKDIWSDCNDNNVPARCEPLENICSIEENSQSVSFHKENSDERLCESFRSLGLEHLWQDTLPSVRDAVMPRSYNTVMSVEQHEPVDFQTDKLFLAEQLYSMKMKFEDELESKKVKDDSDASFFSSDIPSGPNGPYVELKHTESSGFSTVVPHKTVGEEGLHEELLLMNEEGEGIQNSEQDEENLLTSPRTHFRPIRQDSNGSTQDDTKFDENQDILNAASGLQDSDLVFQRTDSGTLFLESDMTEGSPKKYMIYREPSVKTNVDTLNEPAFFPHQDQSFVPKFKIINNEKFSQTEDGSIDKELLALKIFDSFNFKPGNSTSVDSIWKPEKANNLKMLWSENACEISPKKEAWEMAITEPSISLPKWSTNDLNTIDWDKDNLLPNFSIDSTTKPDSFMEQDKTEMSYKDDDSLSKIKFIWHDSMFKTPIKPPESNNFRENQPDSSSFKKLETSSDAEHKSLTSASNPWNIDLGCDSKLANERGVDPLWRMQWEVDKEADEILGGLLPSMSLKSPTLCDDLIEGAMAHQIDEKEDLNFSSFFEGYDVEDLDNLEPGWDLNEGFEWGPADENDEEEEQEVLLYENEDGETIMVPVEYMDNSFYDEIFGTETNIPFGGSLPDLPQGHMAEWKKLSRRAKGTRFVPPSRRPCSFYLEGNCRRSDCKFSHDLTAITCRFWEEGSCLKGDTCPFRHGVAPPRRRNRSEGDQASLSESFNFSLKEGSAPPAVSKSRPIPRKNRGSSAYLSSFELDSETDFPCLGSSVESKTGSLDDNTLGDAIRCAKLIKKKKKLFAVAKTSLNDCDVDGKLGHGTKISRSERRKAKNMRIATLSDAYNEEIVRKKKKLVRDKEKIECESLRKILRKRHATAPQPSPNRHEDGTLSDF